MSGETREPTGAAVRAAEAIAERWWVREQARWVDASDWEQPKPQEVAAVIDERTGLPELIAAVRKALRDDETGNMPMETGLNEETKAMMLAALTKAGVVADT